MVREIENGEQRATSMFFIQEEASNQNHFRREKTIFQKLPVRMFRASRYILLKK